MPTHKLDQLLNQIIAGTVSNIINGFLVDRKSQGLSPKTIRAYSQELDYFREWLDMQGVVNLEEITADVIRSYMLELSQRRNPRGCHIAYRVIKTMTFWWEQEMDGEYRSPIRKVKPPRLHDAPLDPVDLNDVAAMIETCEKSFLGARDKAILLCLCDTGCRANEFVSIDLEDLNLMSGAITIRFGKGGKIRTVFVGRKTRKAMRAYLKMRKDNFPSLWVTDDGERITYSGLRQIVRRRATKAGIKEPSLHSFRRAFAINMLRAGVDVFSLQLLMGHSDLSVLRRYVAQTDDDLHVTHMRGSPVERMLNK